MVEHRDLHATFTAGIPPEAVAVWDQELSAWEANTSLPNPLETRVKSM